MPRRLATLAAAASLVLCVATGPSTAPAPATDPDTAVQLFRYADEDVRKLTARYRLEGDTIAEVWTNCAGTALFLEHGFPGQGYDVAIFSEGSEQARRVRGSPFASYYDEHGLVAWQQDHLLRFVDGAVIDKWGERIAVLMDRDASNVLFWDATNGKVHLVDVRDRDRAPVSLAVDIFPYHVAVAGERLLLFGWDADQMRRRIRTPKHVCITISRGAAGAAETRRVEIPYGTVRAVDPTGRFVVVYRQVLPTLWKPFAYDMETGKWRTLPTTGLYVFADRDWIGELMRSKAQVIPLP